MAARRTVRTGTTVHGIGLHGGRPSSATLSPSPAGSGIHFRLPGGIVAAGHEAVERVPLCTRLTSPSGARLDTVEHLMAALRIAGVTDVRVSTDSSELPILDGSAQPWLEAITAAGILDLGVPAARLDVVRPFSFRAGESLYDAVPGAEALEVSIDFDHSFIGRRAVRVDPVDYPGLASARTFTLASEISALRASGLALGGSLENAVVIGPEGVLNPGGLRHPEELVRHKALDLLGDLALAGAPIEGLVRAHRPGHAANNAFLRALLASGAVISSDHRSTAAAA